DEDLLNGIVQVVPQGRAAPARAEVGPHDAEIAPGQLLAIGRTARRGGANDGPAGRFGSGHGRRWLVGASGPWRYRPMRPGGNASASGNEPQQRRPTFALRAAGGWAARKQLPRHAIPWGSSWG